MYQFAGEYLPQDSQWHDINQGYSREIYSDDFLMESQGKIPSLCQASKTWIYK